MIVVIALAVVWTAIIVACFYSWARGRYGYSERVGSVNCSSGGEFSREDVEPVGDRCAAVGGFDYSFESDPQGTVSGTGGVPSEMVQRSIPINLTSLDQILHAVQVAYDRSMAEHEDWNGANVDAMMFIFHGELQGFYEAYSHAHVKGPHGMLETGIQVMNCMAKFLMNIADREAKDIVHGTYEGKAAL